MGRTRTTQNRDLPPYLYRYQDGFYLFERPDGRRFSLGKFNRLVQFDLKYNIILSPLT